MITQKELKTQLSYNSSTGVFNWLTGKQGRSTKKPAGSIHKSLGYSRIMIGGELYYAHRLAWLYVYGKIPKEEIDHINKQRDDNSINNLREVSSGENLKNQHMQKRNTSGVTGVRWESNRKRWFAQIGVNGETIKLGRFKRLSDAKKAREEAELKYNFHPSHGKIKTTR
tara:strand:- start:60 stop:566 length:507 start_codon:yes stop_codon:yes gene_type:complete